MLHLLLFPFKLIFGILYALSCLIFDIIKFFIPYKLRAKDVSKEIILVTGAGIIKKLLFHTFNDL